MEDAQHLGGGLGDAVGERLGVAAEARERCSQLVRHVLDQASSQLLRPLERVGHAVERIGELAQLRVRRRGHARPEIAGGDGTGGIGQSAKRSEQPHHEPPRGERSEDDSHERADDHHPADGGVEHRLGIRLGEAGLHGQPHDLVGAEALDRDHDHRRDDERHEHEEGDQPEAQRDHAVGARSLTPATNR